MTQESLDDTIVRPKAESIEDFAIRVALQCTIQLPERDLAIIVFQSIMQFVTAHKP